MPLTAYPVLDDAAGSAPALCSECYSAIPPTVADVCDSLYGPSTVWQAIATAISAQLARTPDADPATVLGLALAARLYADPAAVVAAVAHVEADRHGGRTLPAAALALA